MRTTTFKHPLANLVMSSFEKDPHQDAIKVAVFLGAPINCPKELRAYKIVAQDVLGLLHEQGLLLLDGAGWYKSVIREQLGG